MENETRKSGVTKENQPWTPADDAEIARLWEMQTLDGRDLYSKKEIGQMTGRSENSIIARRRRLGLIPRKYGEIMSDVSSHPHEAEDAVSIAYERPKSYLPPLASQLAESDDEAAPAPVLMQARPHQAEYPAYRYRVDCAFVTEAWQIGVGAKYCCVAVEPKGVYCPKHANICYARSRDAQRLAAPYDMSARGRGAFGIGRAVVLEL